MKDSNDEKKDKQKKGISPVAAAVTGALIGAGALVAGAIVMSDKNNQRKVKKAVSDAKDKIKGVRDSAKEKMDQVSGKVKDVVEVAKEPLDKKK